MSRPLLALAVLLVLSACKSPTSPEVALKAILDNATPDIKINGVTVQPGSITNVTVGTTINYVIKYTNHSGQTLHTAVVFARDDGAAERLAQCGASNSGGGEGGFGSGTTFFANDPVFTAGHTVRMVLLAALGAPGPSGPGQCLLQLSPGQVNHAAVQTERLLATLAVQ